MIYFCVKLIQYHEYLVSTVDTEDLALQYHGISTHSSHSAITVTWRLKSPAFRLFAQPFVQAHIKENIRAPRHWPLWGEFTGDQWIPRTKGQ